MKNKIITLFALTFAIHLLLPATAAEYTLSGKRFLRKYTAQPSPVYMVEIDAQRIADTMCKLPWEESVVSNAIPTGHTSTNLDWNVWNRERFDAAIFCAGHTGDVHTAFANACCYRFDFPDGELPALTNLSLTVYSDPYNAYGARITIFASDSATIPTDCATVRGDHSGSFVAECVAPRATRTSGTATISGHTVLTLTPAN